MSEEKIPDFHYLHDITAEEYYEFKGLAGTLRTEDIFEQVFLSKPELFTRSVKDTGFNRRRPFVYFIQQGETGPVKIGLSYNPRNCPFPPDDPDMLRVARLRRQRLTLEEAGLV